MDRIRELDGLRAVAVILVIAWHYVGIPLIGGGHSAAGSIFMLGRSGVDLFFVLSGFLIAGILYRNREASNFFSVFYFRRSLRIWPVYYGFLMCVLALFAAGVQPDLFSGPVPTWTYPLFVQNYSMAHLQTYGAPALGVTWSLAVEEQFYLLFPLVVRYCPIGQIPKLLVCAIIGAPMLRIAAFAYFGNDWYAYVALPCRADSIAIGALVAFVMFDERLRSQLVVCRYMIARAFALMLGGFCILGVAVAHEMSATMMYVGHTFLNVFYGTVLLLVLFYQGDHRLAVLRSGALRGVAAISFCAYVVHALVIDEVFALAGRPKMIVGWMDAILVLIALSVTMMAASASYWAVERWCVRLGHRMRYRPNGQLELTATSGTKAFPVR